jgi:hypothetical protein
MSFIIYLHLILITNISYLLWRVNSGSRLVGLEYQPSVNNTFLSKEISINHQPMNNIFLSKQISTTHLPANHALRCLFDSKMWFFRTITRNRWHFTVRTSSKTTDAQMDCYTINPKITLRPASSLKRILRWSLTKGAQKLKTHRWQKKAEGVMREVEFRSNFSVVELTRRNSSACHSAGATITDGSGAGHGQAWPDTSRFAGLQAQRSHVKGLQHSISLRRQLGCFAFTRNSKTVSSIFCFRRIGWIYLGVDWFPGPIWPGWYVVPGNQPPSARFHECMGTVGDWLHVC